MMPTMSTNPVDVSAKELTISKPGADSAAGFFVSPGRWTMLKGEQRVDYLFLTCGGCSEMTELEYAGTTGCIPMLIATCGCGSHSIKIFNRCDRFPIDPR